VEKGAMTSWTIPKVAEPLFAATANESRPCSTLVPFDLLKEIGRAWGVRLVEFGATLPSEGELNQ